MDEIKPFADSLFVVPVKDSCESRKYYDLMNYFGSIGGFDTIAQVVNVDTSSEKISIKGIHNLAKIMSLPTRVFHKDFVPRFAESLASGIKMHIIETSNAKLKQLTPPEIEVMTTAITSSLKKIGKDSLA